MITKIVLGSIATAAVAVAGLASAPAQAQPLPTYTCGSVNGNPEETVGQFNCQAGNGARPQGPFFGPVQITTYDLGEAWICRGPGFARTPAFVRAGGCQRIG